MALRFDDCVLDLDRFELRRGGESVALEPQAMRILIELINHRDRVVAKTELLDSVWGDRFVSESALTSRIKAVRRAVGDRPGEHVRIEFADGTGHGARIILTVIGTDPRDVFGYGAAMFDVGELRRVDGAMVLVTYRGDW